jgi:hypothetical protein
MGDLDSLLKTVNFSPASLVAGLIFSTIGFVAFLYGKKNRLPRPLIIGIILMVYPLFVSSAVLMTVIGLVLTASLYVRAS